MRFLKFLKKKTETDQENEEMDIKFEETDQQIEIFEVFEKAETDQKYEEMDLKFEETDLKYEETDQFNNFFKKQKRIKNMRERT